MDLVTRTTRRDPVSSARIINLIRDIEDLIKLDEHQLLEARESRLKKLVLHLSIRFESQDNTLMNWETMNKCLRFLRRIRDEVGKGKQLIRDSKRAQTCLDYLLCRSGPDLSRQIREWQASINDLINELIREFQSHVYFLRTGIKHGEVVVELWLRESSHVRIIAVCGSAGVGKTRLLQNVYNTFKVSDFFDVVIWVTVGQSGIAEVQDSIARALNLDLDADHSIDREMKLFEYFMAKKFLLIFEDISASLNLQKLGVEVGDGKGSKIICSSRRVDVIETKWADCGIYIEPLTREESWELFCNVAFKDSHLPQDLPQYIARKVADECRGLPLAIHVVAATMRGKTSRNDWDLAFTQMQREASAHKFPTSYCNIDDHLYPMLRWSYERLPGASLKSCFLYCAMFPRDHEIEVEKMLGMWIAEGLVKSMDCGQSYIKLLVDRCFFQVIRVPHGKVFIKTYNPLLDLAIYIGHKEENCLLMASSDQNFPQIFPPLKIFPLIFDPDIEWNSLPRISFYGHNIKFHHPPSWKWHVVSLSLAANKEMEEVPISLQFFPSLRVLDLSRTKLKLLPIVLLTKARKLKYLDVSYTQIEVLSEVIDNLSELQFLNVSGCIELKSLPKVRKLKYLDVSYCRKP